MRPHLYHLTLRGRLHRFLRYNSYEITGVIFIIYCLLAIIALYHIDPLAQDLVDFVLSGFAWLASEITSHLM